MSRRKRDFYEVLGVAKTADEQELKRAYRELARKFHPDVNPNDPEATERFRQVSEAYATLSDPRERARYDRLGAPGEEGGFGAVAQAVEDVIGDVLRRRRGRQRGRDLRYTLEITFEEAAFGCSKPIEVAVDDDPSAKKRTFDVVIAPGTRDGAIKTLRGEGQPGKGGGKPGDLHVVLRVNEHATLRREGEDVWSDLTITFPQAALGAVVDVATLDGPVKMRIPEGAAGGRVFRLRGRGIPRAAGKNAPRGDHMVRIAIDVPTMVTPRQREALEALARALADDGDPSLRPVSSTSRRGILDRVRSLLDER